MYFLEEFDHINAHENKTTGIVKEISWTLLFSETLENNKNMLASEVVRIHSKSLYEHTKVCPFCHENSVVQALQTIEECKVCVAEKIVEKLANNQRFLKLVCSHASLFEQE